MNMSTNQKVCRGLWLAFNSKNKNNKQQHYKIKKREIQRRKEKKIKEKRTGPKQERQRASCCSLTLVCEQAAMVTLNFAFPCHFSLGRFLSKSERREGEKRKEITRFVQVSYLP